MKFKLAGATNMTDDRGVVNVLIRLRGKGGARGGVYVKGNKTVTLSVLDATVTEVADAIRKALTEEEA